MANHILADIEVHDRAQTVFRTKKIVIILLYKNATGI